MDSFPRQLLTWLGRCCLLGVVVVAVLAFTYPQGLEPVSGLVCGDDLTLAEGPDGGPAVVCTSPTRQESATTKVIALAGLLFMGAVACYSLRSRVTPPDLRAPAAPITH